MTYHTSISRSFFFFLSSGGDDIVKMGNSSSSSPKTGQTPQHIGTMGPLRKSNGVGFRQPMPDEHEVERRFNLVLQQMDLPPERAKILRGYDMSKKWEMICDHVSLF